MLGTNSLPAFAVTAAVPVPAVDADPANARPLDPPTGADRRPTGAGCRSYRPPRTLDLRHGPRRSGLRRVLALPPSQAGLTRTSKLDSNARGAGSERACSPLCFHGSLNMPAWLAEKQQPDDGLPDRLSPPIRPSLRARFVPEIPIRPYPCPIRPFLSFVASGRARCCRTGRSAAGS